MRWNGCDIPVLFPTLCEFAGYFERVGNDTTRRVSSRFFALLDVLFVYREVLQLLPTLIDLR